LAHSVPQQIEQPLIALRVEIAGSADVVQRITDDIT
jgi:hypothetical protein